jgi:dihydrofolate reductase
VSERLPLAMIAAVARGGVIGADNTLPWHLPEDMRHFRDLTTGHAIILGRKTYDSIGRPLPKRRNIVVSRQRGLVLEGCEVAHGVDDAIALARSSDDCPFVIGGAAIYAAAMAQATILHLTRVDADVPGDVHFPELPSDFVETERRPGETPTLTFLTLRR